MIGAIAIGEFLSATRRLWRILWRSSPWDGFPILRAFLDLLETAAMDDRAEVVAPKLEAFLDAVEARSPGVNRAVLFPGARDDDRDYHRLENPPEPPEG